MPRFRDRQRKPGRGKPFRDPKPTILVVCEGEKTEREYIQAFRNHCKNSRVTVEVSREHGVPLTVFENAVRLKQEAEMQARRRGDDNLRYDQVWCLFDVDQHSRIPGAKSKAEKHNIQLAIANPCFELWLLLHFRDHASMSLCSQLVSALKKHVRNYDKSVRFDSYAKGYPDAVQRAKRLDELAAEINEPGRNPTTGVYRLTERIIATK